jgi:DNA-directed RNA polymerase subunit RPC12/RpoP
MIYGHTLVQYFCSECNALLTETDKPIDLVHSSTECPKCGVLLLKSLKKAPTPQQDSSNPAASLLFPRFHTASRLRFDVEKIDSILTFGIGEHICLVGNRSKILTERLCINALLSERHGGFGSSNVIIIDAGNSSDIYNYVNFARQYGLDIKDILKRIIVSRPFTIYQLANLVTCELPNIIQKFETKIIFISGILRMFLEDPSVRVGEGLPIIKEITNSLRKLSDISVIVSFICTPSSPYYQTLLARFDKYIQIINTEFDGRLFAEVGCHKKEDSKIIRLQQLDLEIIHRR